MNKTLLGLIFLLNPMLFNIPALSNAYFLSADDGGYHSLLKNRIDLQVTTKYPAVSMGSNPVIDLSIHGGNKQVEDAYVYKDGKPAYLFNAIQGGKYETASGFVFQIVTDNE